MNRSTDEKDGEEEDPKVDKDIRALKADDLPEEVDGKHTVDPKDTKEQSERHPTMKANLKKGRQQTDRQTDRQADRQTGRQTDRQADRQTGRQTGRQTDRKKDGQTHGT